MRCALRALVAAVLLLLLGNAAGLAQGVNVIGAVTPGNCVSFFSTSQIQDSGSACGGGGGGGAVTSVSGTVGQITVTPTTGAVVVSLPSTITANLTLSGTVNNTGAAQLNGVPLGTFATANFATPPAIGGTSPAAGAFTTLSATGPLTTNVTGSTQCLQVNTSGVVSGTGSACGGGGGTPGGANTNIQFNNASAFGGDAGFTYAGNGQVTHALGTITTNLKALNITGTWNASAVTFDAPLFMNIISTASAAGSLLMDFQVGSSSVFSVDKTGLTTIGGAPGGSFPTLFNGGGTLLVGRADLGVSDQRAGLGIIGSGAAGGVVVGNGGVYAWSTLPTNLTTLATFLINDGAVAGVIAQRNSANAQTFRVYNTADVGFGVATNYERAIIDWTTTANTLTMGTQSGGTGTNRAALLTSSIGVSLSLATAKVVTVGDGAANANGWLQWGGEARVTSDFSVTSSVALVNVTGLSVNVAAGRTYSFATELYVTDAAAGGVQAAMAGTATATAIQYTGYTIADNAIKAKTNATALATAVGSTVTTETAGIIVRITGTITVNAAGTLTVQMAQNTSNGTATTAKRGSWLLVNDMP